MSVILKSEKKKKKKKRQIEKLKNTNLSGIWFSLVWFLVLILIRAILKQSIDYNGEQNLSWNVCIWYVLIMQNL